MCKIYAKTPARNVYTVGNEEQEGYVAAFSEESLERIKLAIPFDCINDKSPNPPWMTASPNVLEFNRGYGEWTMIRYDERTDDYRMTTQVEKQPRFDRHFPDEEAAVNWFINHIIPTFLHEWRYSRNL